MTPRDELLIDKFIEYEVRRAIGKGHDRDTTYSDRQSACKQSLEFVNSYWFDAYCLFLGYDASKWRRLVCEEVLFKLPLKNRHLTVQIPIEECV